MEKSLLHQFSLAKEHAAWVENERRGKAESTTEGKMECKRPGVERWKKTIEIEPNPKRGYKENKKPQGPTQMASNSKVAT